MKQEVYHWIANDDLKPKPLKLELFLKKMIHEGKIINAVVPTRISGSVISAIIIYTLSESK